MENKRIINYLLEMLLFITLFCFGLNKVEAFYVVQNTSACDGTHCPYKVSGTGENIFCIDRGRPPSSSSEGSGYYDTPYASRRDDDLGCAFLKYGKTPSGDLVHSIHYGGRSDCLWGCNITGDLKFGNVSKNTFTLNSDKYYISEAIPVSFSGKITDYDIKLTGAPTGTIIVTNKNHGSDNALLVVSDEKNSVPNVTATSFYIKIPKSSVKNAVNLTINIHKEKQASCSYTSVVTDYYCSNYANDRGECSTSTTYQRMAKFTVEEKEKTEKIEKNHDLNLKIDTGNLRVIKKDADTGELLAGVEFKLYEASNGTCNLEKEALTANGTVVNPIISKADSYAEIKNLNHGEYCLVETKSLADYILITSPTLVTINKDVTEVTIVNKQIRILISKKAITGEDEIPGAIIKITDEDGKQYIEFESTNEPQELVFEKGTYILTETIAPQGYMPVKNSFKFNIDEQGNIKVLSSQNDQYEFSDNHLTIYNDTSKIYISKKDITNVEELVGAKIKIVCENGFETSFTSGEEPHMLEALSLIGGKCTLTEEVAPEGYEKIKSSLTFEIDKKGDVKVIGKASNYYYTDSNRIIIYNGVFPDTGISTWIGISIIGAGLIAGGTIIIVRNIKKRKQI